MNKKAKGATRDERNGSYTKDRWIPGGRGMDLRGGFCFGFEKPKPEPEGLE